MVRGFAFRVLFVRAHLRRLLCFGADNFLYIIGEDMWTEITADYCYEFGPGRFQCRVTAADAKEMSRRFGGTMRVQDIGVWETDENVLFRDAAAAILQKYARGWIVRKTKLWNVHTDLGRRYLRQQAERIIKTDCIFS